MSTTTTSAAHIDRHAQLFSSQDAGICQRLRDAHAVPASERQTARRQVPYQATSASTPAHCRALLLIRPGSGAPFPQGRLARYTSRQAHVQCPAGPRTVAMPAHDLVIAAGQPR